ncbi:MAG: 2-oxoacid:acceptor oxidoreductase subunit alpha [Bacteroidales bacterium]
MASKSVIECDQLVVKFAGDSGDGMQLIGSFFSEMAAHCGNDLSTFPDYPAEIRAPQNTVAGVSGYQVHVGRRKILSSGDLCDVLIAMNPASLKANLKWAKIGATLILNADTFQEKQLQMAGYQVNPLLDDTLSSYHVVAAPMTRLTKEALAGSELDPKSVEKCRNMFALGLLIYLFNHEPDAAFTLLEEKFRKKPLLVEANKQVLKAGWVYADSAEIVTSVFHVGQAVLEKGKYRNITGNVAVAWGLAAAAERSGRPLFLGSYPITPATEILVELSALRSLGIKTFQAEDEIAGIVSAIGASLTGSLAATSTSGPGFSLKSEALGLAVITELPLVVVNVQRAGPSTGMPTKSEQADLLQALYGRNGEAPLVVTAASSPSDCFYAAYEAAKLALEHMTPVVLLTDGYIGNGSQLFRIPSVADLPAITPPLAEPNDPDFLPYRRDPESLVRKWALPGTEGLRHRIGGLEKTDGAGVGSTDPLNHQKMVAFRAEKVQKVAAKIDPLTTTGADEGDLLVISWGGTYGAIHAAVEEASVQALSVGHAHFRHLMPLPANTAEVLSRYKRCLVCELNGGQFMGYLRMLYPGFHFEPFNKIQGQPFMVSEVLEAITLNLQNG